MPKIKLFYAGEHLDKSWGSAPKVVSVWHGAEDDRPRHFSGKAAKSSGKGAIIGCCYELEYEDESYKFPSFIPPHKVPDVKASPEQIAEWQANQIAAREYKRGKAAEAKHEGQLRDAIDTLKNARNGIWQGQGRRAFDVWILSELQK